MTKAKISEITTLATTVAESDLTEMERVSDGAGCKITHASKRTAYLSHATSLALKVAGTDRLTVTSSLLTSAVQLSIPDTGIVFTSDTGNQIYLGSTDTIGMKTNGVARWSLDTASMTCTLPVRAGGGSAGTVSIAPDSADPDTGLYPTGTNEFGASAGGTGRVKWTTTTYEPIADGGIALGTGSKRFGDVFSGGDLAAVGGFRSFIGPFVRDNVAASLTDSRFAVGATAAPQLDCVATRAGSVMGIAVSLTVAAAGSSPTLKVFKNGAVLSTCTMSVGIGLGLGQSATFAKDTFTFVAGDRLGIAITTDGSWTATTSDFAVTIEVEQ